MLHCYYDNFTIAENIYKNRNCLLEKVTFKYQMEKLFEIHYLRVLSRCWRIIIARIIIIVLS